MHVRDATDEDADAVVALADEAVDAARLIRDRSVRVAEDDDQIAGFVAYDTWRGAVHVTRLGGDPSVLGDLLVAPCEFAEREDLPVEVVLPDEDDDEVRSILDEEGFEDAGAGPMFDGRRTRRYRRRP